MFDGVLRPNLRAFNILAGISVLVLVLGSGGGVGVGTTKKGTVPLVRAASERESGVGGGHDCDTGIVEES